LFYAVYSSQHKKLIEGCAVQDSELTEEQRLIQESVRALGQAHFAPGAAKADRDCAAPVENLEVLAKNGFLGLSIPEEYGGAGLGVLETVWCSNRSPGLVPTPPC